MKLEIFFFQYQTTQKNYSIDSLKRYMYLHLRKYYVHNEIMVEMVNMHDVVYYFRKQNVVLFHDIIFGQEN